MTSLYEQMFDDIPLYVVHGTEDSDVIEYETNAQRCVRILNETRLNDTLREIRRLEIEIVHAKLVGTWMQKRLPERSEA